MANPWDPLPLPVIGDLFETTLYEALGRIVNRWEYMEVGLAIMYSLFAGDATFAKMAEYGSGRIFKDRLAGLRRVAAQWFIKKPDQMAEGEFDRITAAAAGFSDRRNEFAHGIVMDVSGIIFWRVQLRLASPETPQFLLVPAFHVIRKHGADGMPQFGYSSSQLALLRDRIADLEISINEFKSVLWPSHWPTIRADKTARTISRDS